MQTTTLPLDKIVSGDNPRQQLLEEPLEALTQSIATHGVLEPIRVVDLGNGMYRIESGHRRYNAALAAQLSEIPAVVTGNGDTPADDEFVRAIVTNVQREDLTPVDEAKAFLKLLTEHGLTPEGVAQRVGVAQRRVTERLELLEFPPEIIDLFASGKLQTRTRSNLRSISRVSSELAVTTAQYVAEHPRANEVQMVLSVRPGAIVAAVIEDHPQLGYPIRNLTLKSVKGLKVKKSIKDRLQAARAKDYGGPVQDDWSLVRVDLSDALVDAARAAGVLYEGKMAVDDDKAPFRALCSLEWLQDRLEDIAADEEHRVEELLAERARRRAQYEGSSGSTSSGESPLAEWDKERKKFLTEVNKHGRDKAEAHNDELAQALLTEGWTLHMDVSKEWAQAIASAFFHGCSDTVFTMGLGLLLPQFYETTDKGKRVYNLGRADGAVKLREWLAAAKTGWELMDRVQIAIAAALLADLNVLPGSSRVHHGLPFPTGDTQYIGQANVPTMPVKESALLKGLPAKVRKNPTASQAFIAEAVTNWEKLNPQPGNEADPPVDADESDQD